MRKKNIAGFFALFFGVFGLHRFYLGQRFLGILYFATFCWGLYLVNFMWWVDIPVVAIPPIVGFIDAMLLFAMPKAVFDEKYNSKIAFSDQWRWGRNQWRSRGFSKTKKSNPFKADGIEKFRNYDFEGAIEDFKHSLEVKYEDPATHFNLTCCYSILEDAEPALFHLDKAVEFGFVNFEKIYRHDALSYLRIQPQFEEFVKNGYRLTSALPSPREDLLSSAPEKKEPLEEDLLDQIGRLGDLRDKGILTEEEFLTQKKKLLEGS